MHIPARRCQVFHPGKRRKLHNGALKASPSALMFLEDDHVRTSVRAKRRMILGTRPTSHPSIPLIFQGSASVEMSGLSIDACKDDDEDQRDSEREIGSIGGQPGSIDVGGRHRYRVHPEYGLLEVWLRATGRGCRDGERRRLVGPRTSHVEARQRGLS